jgi:hypothetical protein
VAGVIGPAWLRSSFDEDKLNLIMKTYPSAPLLLVCVTGAFIAVGCSHLRLPPASRYAVVCGQVEYSATSIKEHGKWLELQTDKGPIWFNRDSVTSIRPVH